MSIEKLMALNFAKNDLEIDITEEEADKLLKKLKGLKEFASMQQLYNAAIKEVTTKLEVLDEEFKVRFDHNPIHSIESRLKAPRIIFGKLYKNDHEITIDSIRRNLFDVAGVRVICSYIDDIYQMADFLTRQDDIKVLKRKDYIASPKENGYRSLHLVVEIPIFLSEKTEQVPVEIQIRTIAMDFWASLEHQLRYKASNDITDDLRQELKNCAESIADIDRRMQDIYHTVRRTKEK